MPENAIKQMTVEEYLKFEERSDVRHEYVDGYVFAMTGATEAHNVICINLVTRLHTHLRGSGCRVFANDMKVHIKDLKSFYCPDIMVTCEPFDAKSVYKGAPVFIAEVLSPSTAPIDRREKLVAYRKLQSLREYAIIHHNKMLIEFYTKDSVGEWKLNRLHNGDELALESLPRGQLRIPVDVVYEQVELPSVVDESEEEYEL